MDCLTEAQRHRLARVIKCKRKELFGYVGGNKDLAKLLGVSPQLISMWAYNKRQPGYQDLLKLSEVFDIPMDELYRLNTPRKKPVRNREKAAQYTVNPDDARNSMVRICDITTELLGRQKQMLHGEVDAKRHRKVLSRIKKYVDTI